MPKDDQIRLRHMLEAARDVMSFAEKRTREDLDNDRQLELALVKAIEVIGEAATKLTKQCRDKSPQIPWDSIIGMRNRLIHAYFDVNRDILWSTVEDDLPPLIVELERILGSESPSAS
jgi:uncharacterized protein with HEPN domain